MKEMKITKNTKALIFHHFDGDGFCACYWAVRHALDLGIKRSNIKTVTVDYDCNEDEIETDANTVVYVVDYTFSSEKMEYLYNASKNLIWVDHHGTALDRMRNYKDGALWGLDGIRFDGVAACELMWVLYKYGDPTEIVVENGHVVELDFRIINPFVGFITNVQEEIPIGTYWASDNDTFAHNDKRSIPVASLIKSILPGKTGRFSHTALYDMYFGEDSNNFIDYLVKKGEEIFAEEEKEMEELCKTGYPSKLIIDLKESTEEYSVFVIDSVKFNSLMFKTVVGEYDLFIKHHEANTCHKFTMYRGNSERGQSIHCGKLCLELGGGGHPGAAGFQASCNIFKTE